MKKQSGCKSKYNDFDNSIKAVCKDKDFLGQLKEYLNCVYECQATSPIMYDADKDRFFQYFSVKRKEA